MADFNDIVKLAVDTYHGVQTKYSADEASNTLRQALIAANNGSTVLDVRAIRDGKCAGLFALIEEILSQTVVEGLQANDWFMRLVDFKNVPLGDKTVFEVEDNTLFTVADIADGTQGLRRQRLAGSTEVTINTSLKGVKIYEELNRILSGRVDINKMIDKVSKSFEAKLLDDIFALWTGATSDDFGTAYIEPDKGVVAGTYDEDKLLDIISHVEAASGGQTATVICSKKAARKIAPNTHGEGEASKTDLYTKGYFTNFYGTPVVVAPQRHKMNSTTFAFPDDVITVVAGAAQPIKVIREGDPFVVMGNSIDNADLTQNFLYTEKWGAGLVIAGNEGIGRYQFT